MTCLKRILESVYCRLEMPPSQNQMLTNIVVSDGESTGRVVSLFDVEINTTPGMSGVFGMSGLCSGQRLKKPAVGSVGIDKEADANAKK